MIDIKPLTQETSEEDKYDEEWKVVMNTKGTYILNKLQASILMQAMSSGKREVIFQTFIIAIPYIAEFFRVKRFLKDTYKLPERTEEVEYVPIPKKRFEQIKKEAYAKIGK